MRITQLDSQLLRLPLNRPIAAPSDNDPSTRLNYIFMLIVHLDTDAGHRGLGFAYTLQGGGRALKVLADDDLAPLVIGEDPLDHERLSAKVHWRLQGIGRRGLVAQAYSAVDLALWDLKGKVAGLPLYKLLGGARESAMVYGWAERMKAPTPNLPAASKPALSRSPALAAQPAAPPYAKCPAFNAFKNGIPTLLTAPDLTTNSPFDNQAGIKSSVGPPGPEM